MLARSLITNQRQHSTTQHPSKILYRYNLTLRNPFPGSIFHDVAGHHFVELLFQFMTLMERYPIRRLSNISIGFAHRLIKFAVGEAPWGPYEAVEQRIAVVSSRDGWQVYTREEDVRQGGINEEGGRRYEAWEVIEEILAGLGENREDILRKIGVEGLASLCGPLDVESKVDDDI